MAVAFGNVCTLVVVFKNLLLCLTLHVKSWQISVNQSINLYRAIVQRRVLIHRRRSGWTSGGTHGERRRWVGAEWGGIWGGVSPLQGTKGSRERHELPQRGSGQSPR